MNPIMYTANMGQLYQQKIEIREDIYCFKGDNIFLRPVMEVKLYKTLGHLFFPDNDIIVWIDANITLKRPLSEIIPEYLGDNDLVIFQHNERDCIYKEFDVLRKTERLNIPFLHKRLQEQESFYRSRLFPENYGLWETNFIIRRNKPEVNALFNEWWCEISRWQWRDQVSFPVVLNRYANKIKFASLTSGNIRNHKDFEYIFHY